MLKLFFVLIILIAQAHDRRHFYYYLFGFTRCVIVTVLLGLTAFFVVLRRFAYFRDTLIF